eukprot:CAMPEP_0172449422 /NCGR_PEP_ID=MMETSP1065-20121228/8137_1 /TAXON_ID=265537 /ORGANISM="Amphiprora paludosa, Strain CCMP125" /LENGTH=220 /DNA_ID=CAMNT_0013201095 /DNA_START=23 /DNA_END=685 /DNA_ORIENTATION=-
MRVRQQQQGSNSNLGNDLHSHARKGEWDKFLEGATADPNQLLVCNKFLATPLHYAFRYGAPTRVMIELFPITPSDAHFMKNKEGNLPIHVGCDFGVSVATVTALLQIEPTVLDEKNKAGETPLEVAKSGYVWPIGLAWHFFPEDFERVVTVLEDPGVKAAMFEMSRGIGSFDSNDERECPMNAKENQSTENQDEWVGDDSAAETKRQLSEALLSNSVDPL